LQLKIVYIKFVKYIIDLKVACIYKIINLVNEKFYIGSTTGELRRRKNAHLAKLRHNKHYNPLLQSSWNKYGEENFEFIELETVVFESTLPIRENRMRLLERELYLIVNLNPHFNVNRITTAGSLGRIVTQEQREHLSKKLKGRKRSPQEIENLIKGKIGVKQTKEHREAVARGRRGKPLWSSKPICMYNLDNELIAEYEFQGQAVKETGINKTSISNNANGRRKTAGGYIFKFKKLD